MEGIVLGAWFTDLHELLLLTDLFIFLCVKVCDFRIFSNPLPTFFPNPLPTFFPKKTFLK